ncbi:MAG: type IV pilus secretin PilQ [Deltaproteobacteria bacterium]|nr:type IV pilus secretin PilQ [Deltaproteobacteria bacterium]
MTRARAAVLLVALILVRPAFLQGGDRGANRIHKITYSEEADETVIKVTADETPTFSVFKLDDPVRLFVDVSRGETGPVSNPIVVDNGVIDQIGTLQFMSGGVPVGRVIIGLRDNAPYDVSSQGNQIVIRVDGQGRRASEGEATELARKVTSIRDRLDKERELLGQVQRLRQQEEALRAKEEASRKESERLRAKAMELKVQAERDASKATAKASKASAEATKAAAEATRASARASVEKERLALIQREKELAVKERQALAAAAAAAREKADAMKQLARQAAARRNAEESVATKAEQARKAAQAAVVAENKKLAAVRAATKAEQAHRVAMKTLADREKRNLEQTRTAREKEETLLANLAEARERQARVAKRAKESHDAALAAELKSTRKKVADLKNALEKSRVQATNDARKRDQSYQAAVAQADTRKAELWKARQETATVESRMQKLQAERDQLAGIAETARAEAARLKALSEQAAVIVQEKETARKDAEAVSIRVAAQQKELAKLKMAVKAEEKELEAVALRKDRESRNLARVVSDRKQAQASWEEVTKRLSGEEERLALLSSERARVERTVGKLRSEIDDLSSRRKSIETAEASHLRGQLETRQQEVETLKDQLVAARTQAKGKKTAREQSLAKELARKEIDITQLRTSYEEALLKARAEGEAIRTSYEARLNKAKAEGDWKDETIRDLADKISRAQDEVKASRKALASREADIAALRTSLADAEVTGSQSVNQLRETLQRKVSEAQEVRTDLADRLARTDELASKRAAEIARLSQELERFKARNTKRESSKVKGLKDSLQAREIEIQVLKKAYRKAQKSGSGKTRDQKKRLAALKKSLKQQKSERKRIESEYAHEKTAWNRHVETRDRRITALTEQIDALKASKAARESREVARLHELVTAKESEVASLKDENRRANEHGSRMTSEMRAARKAITEAEKDLKTLKGRFTTATQREKAALRKEIAAAAKADKLMHELEGTRAERDSLAVELDHTRQGLAAAEKTAARERARIKAELEQEKSRRDRLARELADVKAKVAKASRPSPARAAAHPAPAARSKTKSHVKTVDFKEMGGIPSVVMKVKGRPDYKVISVNDRSYVLTVKNATLAGHMARRMDVTAFESPVSMVTSFSDSDGTVQVVADLAKPTGQRVQFVNGKLVWKFNGPPAGKMFAGASPTPTTGRSGRMLASAQGKTPSQPLVPTMSEMPSDKPQKYRKPSMVPKKKKYKGKRINLTVKDADIQNVLTFLAREGRVNIVTSENVRGKVTFHLEDVPWDLALDTVLKAKGLDYVVEQGIFRVAPIDDIQREYEARVKKMQKVRELKPVLVRLIPVNYGNGTNLMSRVRSVLSEKGIVAVDDRTNTLIIKDTEDYLTAAEELVRRLDQQTPQVLIEARIVEARTTFKEDIGIQWGGKFAMGSNYGNETGLVFPSSIGLAGGADDQAAPQNGIALETPNFAVNLPAAVGAGSGGAIGIELGSIGGAANLSLRLSAAEEEGTVKIISSPRISTLDNTKATISQGVAIPISVVSAAGVNTQFFSADLKLDVTPHVTRDGHISLKLDITKNEPDFGNVAANGNPTIQKKEAHTELLIRDGDTTVIGGIYTRSKGKSFKKIPFFGDIPILGWFFKSKTRTDDRSELLIFITPKVVNREVAL